MSTQAEVHHTAQCLKYQYEVTVHGGTWRAGCVMESSTASGRGANDTKSVHFHLALQDLWDLEGPPLSGVSDEEGVELQRRVCEKMPAAAREQYAEGDPVVICDCPRGP